MTTSRTGRESEISATRSRILLKLTRRPLNENLRGGMLGSNYTCRTGYERAALRGAALIKDNPHLIFVRAVHERDFEAAREEEGRSLRLRRFDLQTTAGYRKNPWKLDQRRIA